MGNKQGHVAEGLGKALQKLVQRFESARDLTEKTGVALQAGFFYARNFALWQHLYRSALLNLLLFFSRIQQRRHVQVAKQSDICCRFSEK